jgi:hypothetical protein
MSAMTMARMIGRAGIAGAALAVVLGASGCNAQERVAERREPVQPIQQTAHSGQSLDPDIEDATTGRDLAGINALLAEIEADLRQTDLDVTTDEGDVQ